MARRVAAVLLLCLLAAACDAIDRAAADEYETAMKRWNEGDYQGAVKLYIALARNHPFSPYADNALYWAGLTRFLYLGETDKGLRTLQRLVKKYPRRDMTPAAQYQIAQIYELGYSDYERAIEEYGKAAGYTNREIREKSLYGLGDNLFRIGKVVEANDAWLRQTAEFPNGPQAALGLFRLGTTAFARGALEEAEAYYRRSLGKDPDAELVVKTKFALANCLEAGENLQEALDLYREIEPVYPNPEAIGIKISALETRIKKKSY